MDFLVETVPKKETDKIAKLFPEIDDGEAAVIALAIKEKTENVVIDDTEARTAAEYFRLKVYGALYIMLQAFKQNILKSKDEVRNIVDNMLRRGFYLSTEVYAKFLYFLEKIN